MFQQWRAVIDISVAMKYRETFNVFLILATATFPVTGGVNLTNFLIDYFLKYKFHIDYSTSIRLT